ncbi:hypothetical protein [Indiicoccus explosivorum]|uniref:hypothetical protein n=1 Tax=Indiicoccus explosivorum TaxID=1917864 RepID=UPI000B44B0AB|nr:hypothetical protein [Indiicoccus explosivorum]
MQTEMTVTHETTTEDRGILAFTFTNRPAADRYETIRLFNDVHAVIYHDADAMGIEVLKGDGSQKTLAVLALNDATRQLVDDIDTMEAVEVFALMAEYGGVEL